MTSSNSQMHNDIMAAGSKDRPPMVVPGPHVFGQVKKPVESENTKQEEEFIVETYQNTTDAVRKLIDVEAEAVHMILNGIGDDIYSTMDACLNAKEMWIAIERLQQGEPINKQDVKAKLFWEFGNFTSMEEESIKSYYIRRSYMLPMTSRPTYDAEPLEKAHPDDDYNVFAIEKQHFEQPESINDIYLMEKVDSNVTPDSSKMSTNELGVDQNNEEPENERVLLASLIANLKLDVKYDKHDLANLFAPGSEETSRLVEESRSKLDLLIPLAQRTLTNTVKFKKALKDEISKDFQYIQTLEKEIDDLKMDVDELNSQLEIEEEFLKVDDLLLQ
ncbi:hypothetical protein Tco_0695607 [Tanacetum coccineum]